jgi:hypothetical protein
VEKNEVLPEYFEADVRSRDLTYSPKYHSGRIQSRVCYGTLFSPAIL